MIPPRSRLLIGLAAGLLALVVIGAILQAIRGLLWDLSYLLPGWLLTPVLLLAVGLILALGVQIGWPWWQSWQRRKRRPDQASEPQLQVPSDRREAATRSLDSIDRVLEQLEDDITREGLRREHHVLKRNLRGETSGHVRRHGRVRRRVPLASEYQRVPVAVDGPAEHDVAIAFGVMVLVDALQQRPLAGADAPLTGLFGDGVLHRRRSLDRAHAVAARPRRRHRPRLARLHPRLDDPRVEFLVPVVLEHSRLARVE